ncbi:hypothetical protein JTE90_027887 [Oedothorax gibbosus]|uniref:Uncharacterized protein n=1 Tax=Oedothorax gibbosus TaxID=931172 RepID=A0AAV6U8D9_9ARAC|nr:hypothetical protein JTE90_027887 [Oedothorax gibbosus]
MSAGRETSKYEFGYKLLLLWAFVACCSAEKYQYATLTECDRHSLDALYHEKFKIITSNVFKDTIEFVTRVSDSISDSLTSIMATLPDRTASDNQEQKIYMQFKNVKGAFTSKAKKLNSRIIQSWESLLVAHFDLMYDRENCTLEQYRNKTKDTAELYTEARQSLDASMGSFIKFIKGTVRDGLQGISAAAADALKKDAKKKDKESENKEDRESAEDKLLKKKLEIAEMVTQGFLGQVTTEVIKRDIDLFKKVEMTTEERESVLDDLEFDMLMMRGRVLALSLLEFRTDKGAVDLARRSIYTYYADKADEMYKEKINAKKSATPGGDTYYRKLWSDETVLRDTLLSLMEIYP